MSGVRHYLLVALAGLAWLGAMAPARASSIYEPNNSPAKAYVLPGGQTVVSDDLNGNVGRPDTILGEYDSSYSFLGMVADNTTGVGNGFGSKLTNVEVRDDGSAYFAVSGAPDGTFEGGHMQFGKYSVLYQVYNALHQLVKTETETEWVTPGMIDYVWLDPDDALSDADYTVDVTVTNVAGPGSGDSLDFFVFTGLAMGESYTVQVVNSQFSTLIGWYDSANNRISSAASSLSVTADPSGRVKIGVTGMGDTIFEGAHALTGQYTLQIVPEPAGAVTFGLGMAVVGVYWTIRRVRRRTGHRAAA
jgi:hypothetical protein